jgi:hypothetical protein
LRRGLDDRVVPGSGAVYTVASAADAPTPHRPVRHPTRGQRGRAACTNQTTRTSGAAYTAARRRVTTQMARSSPQPPRQPKRCSVVGAGLGSSVGRARCFGAGAAHRPRPRNPHAGWGTTRGSPRSRISTDRPRRRREPASTSASAACHSRRGGQR